MMKVLSASTSRADVGILRPVWTALAALKNVELHVFLTGAHLAPGAPKVAIPEGCRRHMGGADLGGSDADSAGHAMAEIAAEAARLCSRLRPDIVIVIGDRLDMLPVATGSLAFNIPLVHLHGGELSLGAIDDRNRHALTKLSHLHCAATASAATRICRMGEEPWRVRVTGAPGLDTLLAAEPLSEGAFAAALSLPSLDGFRLVTVHSETNAADPTAIIHPILAALDKVPAPTIFTASNADPGGKVIDDLVRDFAAAREWAVYRDTLGMELYPSALRHAAVMVGNSSSGIIEAALFDLPVINVGSRQAGRDSGANVTHCAADTDAIRALLDCAGASRHRPKVHSLYGDGHAAPRIANFIAGAPSRERLLDKQFFEGNTSIAACWTEKSSAWYDAHARSRPNQSCP